MILTDQKFSWGINTVLELNIVDYLLLAVCTVVLFIVSFIQEKNPDTSLRVMLDQKPFLVRYFALLIGITMIVIFGIYGPRYDAADFVYMQF